MRGVQKGFNLLNGLCHCHICYIFYFVFLFGTVKWYIKLNLYKRSEEKVKWLIKWGCTNLINFLLIVSFIAYNSVTGFAQPHPAHIHLPYVRCLQFLILLCFILFNAFLFENFWDENTNSLTGNFVLVCSLKSTLTHPFRPICLAISDTISFSRLLIQPHLFCLVDSRCPI